MCHHVGPGPCLWAGHPVVFLVSVWYFSLSPTYFWRSYLFIPSYMWPTHLVVEYLYIASFLISFIESVIEQSLTEGQPREVSLSLVHSLHQKTLAFSLSLSSVATLVQFISAATLTWYQSIRCSKDCDLASKLCKKPAFSIWSKRERFAFFSSRKGEAAAFSSHVRRENQQRFQL